MLLLCIMNGTAQAKTGSILTKAIFSTDNTSAEKMALVNSNQDEKHEHTDKDVEKYAKQATALYEQGKYKESLNILDKAITRCEAIGLSFYPQHLSLLLMRYSIYYDRMNNRYKAYKLMNAILC